MGKHKQFHSPGLNRRESYLPDARLRIFPGYGIIKPSKIFENSFPEETT